MQRIDRCRFFSYFSVAIRCKIRNLSPLTTPSADASARFRGKSPRCSADCDSTKRTHSMPNGTAAKRDMAADQGTKPNLVNVKHG
jgi:hypothetical protein